MEKEINSIKIDDFKYNNVLCVPQVHKIKKVKNNDWPGLEADSYIWDCLRRYHNTMMNLSTWDNLAKQIWHRKIGKIRPTNWFSDSKYEDNVKICIKEIEDYISKGVGFNIKMRYVKVNKSEWDTLSYLYGRADKFESALYKDFWVLEKK